LFLILTEKQTTPMMNSRGYSGKGKNITTKHDAVLCGRKNASKMMEVRTVSTAEYKNNCHVILMFSIVDLFMQM